MRDLRSRWNSSVVLLSLAIMFICSALESGARVIPGSTALVANQRSVNFGAVVVGDDRVLALYILNPTRGDVTVTGADVSSADFQVTAPSLPVTIPSGQWTRLEITFAPQAAGSSSATVEFANTAPQSPLKISLFGRAMAAGQLVVNPANISFGSVPMGSSQNMPATVVNMGGTSVTVSQASSTVGDFTISGMRLPYTLQPNQSATFNVAFSPKANGNRSGNISLVGSSSTSPFSRFRNRRTGPVQTATLQVAGIGGQAPGTGNAAGPLTAAPGSVDFGTPASGSSQSKPIVITNSGTADITVNSAAVTGAAGYTVSGVAFPLALPGGQSATLNITFAPTSTGAANGTLTIASTASNPTLNVGVTATVPSPGSLVVSTNPVTFGTVPVGTSLKRTATITNSGGSSVTVNQARVTGTGFTIGTITTPMTLAAGQSTNVDITCAPQSAGSLSGNLMITSTASDPSLAVVLTGNAVTPGALTATPSSFAFGSVQSGNTQTLPGTLTNSGGTSVTVSQASFTGGPYTLTGMTLPLTLAAGQSQSFSVAFAPTSAGAQNFNLSITSNAPNPTLTVPISGSGVTPGALSASAPSLSFGNVPVSTSKTLPETITNTGGTSIKLNQAAAGSGYSVSGLSLPLTLGAGQSTSFNVVFAPTASGSASVNLAIANDGPASTFSIPLSGTGTSSGALTVSSVSFGNVQVGNNSTLPATVKNSGGSPVTISGATLSGAGFTMSGLTTNPPLTLAAGQTFTFNVTFTPTSAAAASGNIALVSDLAGSTPSISLSGTGTAVGQFSVTPGTLAFGSVIVGANKSLTGTLSATGSSVTVTSASVNSPEFVLSGISLPLTIKAGATAPFTLMFSPQSSGAATGTVSFLTSASTTAFTESLTGAGTPAPQHSVDLSWNPSGSTVSGYNVYRAGKTGGPYSKINPSLDGTTSYADSSVQAGQTYFYVTTAVASDGTESTFSNEVNAVIPTP